MSNIPDAIEELEESTARARVLIPIEGGMLVLLGIVAIVLPGLAAIALTVLLGWLFFFSGLVGLIMTLGTRRTPGHRWSLISALAALIAGAFLTIWPLHHAASIMLVLGLFFAFDGIFSIMYAIEHRRGSSGWWGWMLASGIFTVLLGAFIVAGFPLSVVMLGVLVGIDMVFAGAALIAVGMSMKSGA